MIRAIQDPLLKQWTFLAFIQTTVFYSLHKTNFYVSTIVSDVYERLIQKGKKPGFLQLLGTQTVSAIWHVSYIFPLTSFVFSLW